jgi:hypothetical protein
VALARLLLLALLLGNGFSKQLPPRPADIVWRCSKLE